MLFLLRRNQILLFLHLHSIIYLTIDFMCQTEKLENILHP